MRGKVITNSPRGQCRWITPAYAGKRATAPTRATLQRDHPRICGEKPGFHAPAVARKGSPPHMRGKVTLFEICARCSRITPAYAGKSIRSSARGRTRWDHPRICGEKSDESGRDASECRITPAYAGKRGLIPSSWYFLGDHPRICGEKFAVAVAPPSAVGSPPHMRGKACAIRMLPFPHRITPAYAGKRLKRSRSTVPPVAIVPLFPSVCNKPVASDGSPAGRDAPLFLPAENAVPASPAYNLRSL